MAVLNFGDIPSQEPLAEGMYILNIEEVEEKTSSNGNPMFLIRYKEPESNTAIFENYVLTANSLWKLKELTDALGIEVETVDSTDLIDMLKGQVVKGKVVQSVYEGNTRNNVKKVYAC